ncbi:monocarboxylate transporter 9 isoform X1 [Pogonomyrmex barbatus]|uniref:Monocarboxylate transporter 9 isoform X1 n=1 Tax=Pogonomyrmex barbatus TaxID=144034 RepID=A0A6I9WIA1_9HYME|nr:monocarboxylate transporter 9 isoform X1 [Pogonomyrmex barbatus]
MTATEITDTTINTHTINNVVEKNNAIVKMEKLNEEDEIKLEDLAPDGGWGWIIVLAMILTFFTTIGPSSSFSIIFAEFLEASGQAGMASSLFNSLFMITYSLASLLTDTLLKRHTPRLIGVVGAIFFALPNVALAFVRNIYDVAFICFLQGFGFGFIITISNTVFNSYFVKKRPKVMSASQIVIGLGSIVYPMLCGWLLTEYGFRGTAAIVGGISLHSIVGMSLMHPVEWHAKKPEEVRAERAHEKKQRMFRAMSNRRSTIAVIHVSSKTKCSSLLSLKEENEMPLLIENSKLSTQRVASVSAIENGIRGSLARIRAISASNLVNLANRTICILNDTREILEKRNKEWQISREIKEEQEKQDKEIQEKEEKQDKEIQERDEKHDQEIHEKEEKQDAEGQSVEKKIKFKTILKELVDMSLVKNLCFLNLCFGVSFVCTSDFGFSSLLPLIMTDAGYTKSEAAISMTVSGIAEWTSKILLTIFTLVVNVKQKYIFFTATIFMEFARIGFLKYSNTIMSAYIMIAIVGAVRSWLLVPQPLVIIEEQDIKKFASAYGIYSVISSLVTIIFGAIIGLIKDWTGSYEMYQISLLVLNSAFILPWILQFIFVDFKKWRKQRAINQNEIYRL